MEIVQRYKNWNAKTLVLEQERKEYTPRLYKNTNLILKYMAVSGIALFGAIIALGVMGIKDGQISAILVMVFLAIPWGMFFGMVWAMDSQIKEMKKNTPR